MACFNQIYSEIATRNVTKNKKKFKVFLMVCFAQKYCEIATGNVTKIKKI